MQPADWDAIYRGTRADKVGWYRPHFEFPLALIELSASSHDAAIVDAGGGTSTLVDDLWARGYRDLTLLDWSPAALALVDARHRRLGIAVTLQCADLCSAHLPARRYDIWHDRATLHFLTSADNRKAYAAQAAHCLRPGGSVVISAFASNGPSHCSGMEVVRYSAAKLGRCLGPAFELRQYRHATHRTPDGATQPFIHCRFHFNGG
ncbi:MAG: class I SAM-dependent methyltransferase [Burkholderiales bacterium]